MIENSRVAKIDSHHLVLDDGRILPRQICFVATSAQAPKLFKESELPINKSGFLKVNDQLFVVGYSNLFAAGDCCEFNNLSLPKAGVFAVRQGPIVFKNVLNLIDGKNQLFVYKPQKNFLTILVSGNGTAIASYRHFSFQGKLAWKLKDFIDRRFMAHFQ